MKMKWFHVGLLVALVMAGVISLYASPEPDGLERVAEDHEFIDHAEGRELIESPFPDYVIPQISNEVLSASLAGVLGTLVMFSLALLLGKMLSVKK